MSNDDFDFTEAPDEDEIDPATCPYCGAIVGHEPECPMVDYPFDLEVELEDDAT